MFRKACLGSWWWSEQQKVLQRSSAAASWARALWAERGCCTQIRRAIGSLREQERARGSQREPERARESQSEHASTLFCCKTVKYNSVLSQNVKIRNFLSQNVKIRYFLSRNVKIRAMSRKNGINCAVSWLRILCCSGSNQGGHRGEGAVCGPKVVLVAGELGQVRGDTIWWKTDGLRVSARVLAHNSP